MVRISLFPPVTEVTALKVILAWRALSARKRGCTLSPKTRMNSKESQHRLKRREKKAFQILQYSR